LPEGNVSEVKIFNRMILTGAEITYQVQKGDIVIDPFERASVNPNSYTCHLGNLIKEAPLGVIDPGERSVWAEEVIPERGRLLEPLHLYLSHTRETLGSRSFILSLTGHPSVSNLGLYLQVSADLSQLGPAHCWTLEIMAIQPLRIYEGMPIGQVSFWVPEGEKLFYEGSYAKVSTPLEAQPPSR
jgi:dCTP deaminase